MPSYHYNSLAHVAIPYNTTVAQLQAAEVDSSYETIQQILLDLETNFEDDEILRIICTAALFLQMDWSIEDAMGTAITWERG